MPRYIDAVQCADIISEKLGISIGDLVDVFAEIPSADVVPIIEYEQLKRDLEQCENGYQQTVHLLQCRLDNAAAEKIEMLDEIEEMCFDLAGTFNPVLFAKIKEKHTPLQSAEKCVSCGEVIPEGRQVCPICEGSGKK